MLCQFSPMVSKIVSNIDIFQGIVSRSEVCRSAARALLMLDFFRLIGKFIYNYFSNAVINHFTTICNEGRIFYSLTLTFTVLNDTSELKQ